MEDIVFKDWRLSASVDSDALKLDIEALDGSDITEVGYAVRGGGRDEDTYTLRFTSQQIEEAHDRISRRTRGGDASGAQGPDESYDEGDESGAADESPSEWPADEDETLYVRGWEVTAYADEEGMLNVDVQKGTGNEIYEIDPLESGVPLSSRVILRLGAEEIDEDEDEDDADDGDGDFDDDFDDLDELDELGEAGDFDDDYEDEMDTAEEGESFSLYDDLFDRGGDRDWY
jgi:hypothetical protein